MQPEQMERLLDQVSELAASSTKCSELTALCAQRLDALQCQTKRIESALYGEGGIQTTLAKMEHRVTVLEKIVWGVTMAIILGFVGAMTALVTKGV